MSKLITLTIDGKHTIVPEGTLIVDAAKRLGIDIPVFCYHPKLKPAGMCRMCLVEVGRPVIDRASGQPMYQSDGKPQVQFGPKLETACTTPVSEGMVVLTATDKVKDARKDILEFLLTSHPLDCPVCDKGGECPLQNLTLLHGPGQSRFLYDEKMHLDKKLPLGELIYLDRERCIQCGRCVRFQSELVGDPVISFSNRGRSFEIVSYSDPGFDSYFSGNTTDICPVGALTTTDFRFGARPWEMNAAASLCPHCPVGCNLTFNTRREASADGQIVIKRVMPRQNEAVNEIWICDKGRFAYHYTESPERLTTPLIRRDGKLIPTSWEEAIDRVGDRFRSAGKELLVLASGRLTNEDLFNLKRLAEATGGTAALYTHMAGGDLVTKFGVAPGTDIGKMGRGSVILVAACNLYEEAPIWYLKVKQAAERGATLIVANARPTQLDRFASHTLRYTYGEEAETIHVLASHAAFAAQGVLPPGGYAKSELAQAADAFIRDQNRSLATGAVIFFGSDGMGLAGSQALAQACADLCVAQQSLPASADSLEGQNHSCALIGVWPRANDQGAWELGLQPLPAGVSPLSMKALYVVAADPFGDEPADGYRLSSSQEGAEPPFLVVQDLFLTPTAQLADVILPAQAFTEREGTFTSGDRRVQRFYPAAPARPGCRPDYAITAEIGTRLGVPLEGHPASAVFGQICAHLAPFTGLSYPKLAETESQWPSLASSLNRKGLYFSGTAYENGQGLGVQLPLTSSVSHTPLLSVQGQLPLFPNLFPHDVEGENNLKLLAERGDLIAVPVTCLFDHGQTVWPSKLLRIIGGNRPGQPWAAMNPTDAARMGISHHQQVTLSLVGNGSTPAVIACIEENVPVGFILVPRSFGLSVNEPTFVIRVLRGSIIPEEKVL